MAGRTYGNKTHRLPTSTAGWIWKLCCVKLNFDRGEFFHEAYRIEQKLGRIFREIEPHALFPVDQYFNGTGKYEKPVLAVLNPFPVQGDEAVPEAVKKVPIKNLMRFPLKRVA